MKIRMTKKIVVEWQGVDLRVKAALLEDDEPELCQTLWENLKTPLKMFCRHPVSTGEEFSGEGRPPRHPVKSGTQTQPLGRRQWLMTRIPPGSVVYAIFGGYGGLSLFYGPCTEPLPARGSVVGKVDAEDMGNLARAGKAVWDAQYLTHRPMIMVARRGE
jgi:hypothetical protein